MRALLLAGMAAALSLQAQVRVQSFTLPNGLRVLHLEDHEHPLVRARLHLQVEPSDTPPGRQGLARLTLRMFAHSDAADLKAENLDRLLEDSGIRLASSRDADGLTWRLAARSRDQDRAMGLLADRLLRTVFDPSILELQRLACWRQEELPGASPHARLRQALIQAPGERPTQVSLGTITLEDLQAFRARVFRPSRAVLVIHGDLGLEQAKRLVVLNLGSWTAQEPPPSPAPHGVAAAPTAVPESHPLVPASGPALRVEAVAPRPDSLAPEAGALLELLIPGEAALSPVRAILDQGCLVAILDAEADTPAPEAWSLLHGKLETLRQRGFTQVDLDRARTAWAAHRSLGSLDPEAQLDAAMAEALGHGATVDRMKALSLDGLNSALRSWLDPTKLRSGAAGGPEALKSLPRP